MTSIPKPAPFQIVSRPMTPAEAAAAFLHAVLLAQMNR